MSALLFQLDRPCNSLTSPIQIWPSCWFYVPSEQRCARNVKTARGSYLNRTMASPALLSHSHIVEVLGRHHARHSKLVHFLVMPGILVQDHSAHPIWNQTKRDIQYIPSDIYIVLLCFVLFTLYSGICLMRPGKKFYLNTHFVIHLACPLW